MGLISPEWENLLDFLELWQVLLSYDRDLRDPLWHGVIYADIQVFLALY